MDQILFEQQATKTGKLGIITLNRGDALNALSLAMCQALDNYLVEASQDSRLQAIVIKSNREKCFCAGGDIRYVYQLGEEGIEETLHFFQVEYQMNQRLFHFNKPYIALMDGVTMGGGAGISLHGSHPIVTENTVFAMPEARIGFFTDIGSSYFLSRSPNGIGKYLALTSDSINAQDMLFANLAKHCIASDQLDLLLETLCLQDLSQGHAAIDEILSDFYESPEELGVSSQLQDHVDVIDDCMRAAELGVIIENLGNRNDEWSLAAKRKIQANSPTSLLTILSMMANAGELDFDSIIERDLRLAEKFLRHGDFFEGIRAQIIDKDKQPNWQADGVDLGL